MEGSYTMITHPPGGDESAARRFQVPINTFSLHKAAALH